MATTIATRSIPSFRTHSRVLAGLRALWIVALCAALTATFLVHVWSAPRPEAFDATARVAAKHAS